MIESNFRFLPLRSACDAVKFSETTLENKRLAFFIESGISSTFNPQAFGAVVEIIHSLAEKNDAALFECTHAFDVHHIVSFLSQLPQGLHKRVCLYIIRLLALDGKIDEIVQRILRPAIHEIYRDEPVWFKTLNRNTILDTLAAIQSDLGGRDKIQEEYDLIIKNFLELSHELSAKALVEYLESHPNITEVYGALEKTELAYLDKLGIVYTHSKDERHLTLHLTHRTVQVHLFSGSFDDLEHVQKLQQHAMLQGLKTPGFIDRKRIVKVVHLRVAPEVEMQQAEISPFEKRLPCALEHFKAWLAKSCQFTDPIAKFYRWLSDNRDTQHLIYNFDEFVQFCTVYYKQTSTDKDGIPYLFVEDAYVEATLGREENSHEPIGYDQILATEYTLPRLLENSAERFDIWLKGMNTEELFDWLYYWGSPILRVSHVFTILLVQAHAWGYNHLKNGKPFTRADLNEITTIYRSRRKAMIKRYNDPATSRFSPTLLDFLPVKSGMMPAKKIQTTLKKYLDLLRLGQEALEKFERREMHLFDALVGENACQIRAVIFAEILNKEGIDDQIRSARKQFDEYAEKINTLMKGAVSTRYIDSFKSFLLLNDASLNVSQEVAIIISAFILSETKTISYELNTFGIPSRHERILGKTLGDRKGLVLNFASALIKIAQAKLSEFSVIYVQRLALQTLLCREDSAASQLVFDNYVKMDERHRKITPCYPTMRVLLKGMRKNRIPLVLKIDQFVIGQPKPYGNLSLVYENRGAQDYDLATHPTHHFQKEQHFPLKVSEQTKFQKARLQSADLLICDDPIALGIGEEQSQGDASGMMSEWTHRRGLLQKGAVIFHGKSITEKAQDVSAVAEKILRYKVTDLILSAMADHPQYGCDDTERPNDLSCERYRLLAKEWGTCQTNPSLFLLEHIYCNSVEKDLIQALNLVY